MIERSTCSDGVVICGDSGDEETQVEIAAYWHGTGFPLIISDPPYGDITKAKWDKETYNAFFPFYPRFLAPGGSLYLWGGIGKPGHRPFLKHLSEVETLFPEMVMQNLITWKKRRAYGTAHNYLFTREEVAWFTKGERPAVFHIPLLAEERGYEGYNSKYPAKSKFLRRSNVWTDVNELFKNKLHECHKPSRLFEIMIETHTGPGDFVLDPFAGSGECAVACRKLGRRFVLIEKDEETYRKIVERLK